MRDADAFQRDFFSSPAPGARIISNAPVVCSASPPRRPMIRPPRSRPGRCARAAAAPWSSSRCSNAPISPGRRRPQCSHPGYRRRDPARPDADTIQGRPAPGGRPARAGTAQKQTPEQHNRSVRFSASAFTTHIQTVRYRARPLLGSNWLPRHQRKTAFPIAQSMRPAVRAPKTFRRLTASETLNDARTAARIVASLDVKQPSDRRT